MGWIFAALSHAPLSQKKVSVGRLINGDGGFGRKGRLGSEIDYKRRWIMKRMVMGSLAIMVAMGASVLHAGEREAGRYVAQRRVSKKATNLPPGPPIRVIMPNYKTPAVRGWWDDAEYRLRAVVRRRMAGWDIKFQIQASQGVGEMPDSRVGAVLTFPLLDRHERLKRLDEEANFLKAGYALIREARELAKKQEYLKRDVVFMEAMLRTEGASGYERLMAVQSKMVEVEQRGWEVRKAFDAMVGVI